MAKLLFTIIIPFFLFQSCTTMQKPTPNNNMEANKKQPSPDGKFIVGGQIIKKEFIKKNGVPGGFGELYLRLSVQDYFIKFCESDVSSKELEPYISEDASAEIKSISVEIEIRKGNWDICENDPQEMQSRIGEYVVIKKILSPTK